MGIIDALTLEEAEQLLEDQLYLAPPRQNKQITMNVTCTTWPEHGFQNTYESDFIGHWKHSREPEVIGQGYGTVEFTLDFVAYEDEDNDVS